MERTSHKIVAVIAVLVAFVLFGFNNCSEVGFQTTPEGIQAMRHDLASTSSILIDNGAQYSNQAMVQLTLSSPRAIEMKVSNSPDCSDGAWEPFNSAKTWPVANPNTVVEVFAQYKDIAGNISPCNKDDITHDDIPPTATFVTPTGQATNKTDMTIAWEAVDNFAGLDKVNCRDPLGIPATCDDHIKTVAAIEGSNSIQVKVMDKAGNESVLYVYSWIHDKTPPEVVINSKPASITSSTTATLQFSGTDAHTSIRNFYCRIDTGAGTVCTSPVNYSSLTEGNHKFEVYAFDEAGNQSLVASAQWKVDLTAPDVKFTTTPAPITNQTTATFAFSGTDDGKAITNFECSLDAGGYSACSSPQNLTNVANGSHVYSVRAIDDAGNRSNPISYQWIVDTTAPTLAFTKTPGSLSNSASETFQYNAADAVALKEVQCRLDGGNYALCSNSSHALNNLSEGNHTFQVKAVDVAGNSTTISHTWAVDLTPPEVKITAGPNPYVGPGPVQFEFSGTDSSGVASYECRVDSGSYSSCTSPRSVSIMMEGGHIFYVRAVDAAGNVSSPATRAWTLDTMPPLIRVISAPATLASGSPAAVQYEVLDTSSGLASVMCGLTSPTMNVGNCAATATVSLGVLTADGTYIFEIRATDKVGNMATEVVAIQVTPRPLICDPFDPVGESLCNGGLIGDIYYLTGNARSNFVNMSGKTVDYFYNYGTRVDALLNLKRLAVSTRSFTEGFPTQGNTLIQDNTGNILTEYFAFKLKTVIKLDPVIDQPGWYQFATISDDGSVVNIQPTGMMGYQTLIANDGDHSTKMGCSQNAIYIDDTTRLAAEVKYYQGPRTHIALMMMWRKVDAQNSALDSSCGYADSDAYFGPPPYQNFTNAYRYGKLLERDWKVMAPTNFIAPAK